jgi:hypothetical protein
MFLSREYLVTAPHGPVLAKASWSAFTSAPPIRAPKSST